jgi:competence protein ComEA
MPEFNKIYLVPLAVVILIIGGYYLFSAKSQTVAPAASDGWQVFGGDSAEGGSLPGEQPESQVAQQQPLAMPPQPEMIMIYITGEVVNPGVFELPHGSRVKDAVDAAGGVTVDAQPGAINFSLKISDEDHIIVPKFGEELSETIISVVSSQSAEGAGAQSQLVNINTASNDELQKLPGIGPVMAGRILDYREKNGPFDSIRDIINISGIGEKTFESIADLISVN